ncbi:hypothetical protein D3C87_2051080 [compost metagenome]
MTTLQEFWPQTDVVTASMTMPMGTGEHFGPPVTIGYYPGEREIWIRSEAGVLNVQPEHLGSFIKQLRRAAKLASEQAGV